MSPDSYNTGVIGLSWFNLLYHVNAVTINNEPAGNLFLNADGVWIQFQIGNFGYEMTKLIIKLWFVHPEWTL